MRYAVPAPGSLGDCLARLLAEASGRTRKTMLAGGRVRVNGTITRRADTALAAGDVVEIAARGLRAALPPGLALVYEDGDVIVVEKPQFAAHSVERTYLAVVEGRLARPEGAIASRLLDDAPGRVRETRRPGRGRAAVTRWRVLRTGARHTLLEVGLETGRRNQIRVHLAGLGHPIAGDAAYGSRTDPLGRLALHAHVLGFDHPRTGARLRFVSPAPPAFARLGV